MKIRDTFSEISRKAAEISGSWQASILAIFIVISWTIGGFFFGFTDTYQLVINTGTTIVTFVMVFLIQSAQNRDTRAIQIKLNDLLCSIQKADDKLINIEDATDDEIKKAKENIKQNSGQNR
jgi:low affinity Fe/Cu permease